MEAESVEFGDQDGRDGPISAIGKITFNAAEVLGQGFGGTIVFLGEFEERPVAVKRILPDCYNFADREVKLLRESDDHPNVIRYFCMEADKNFRYIALDLCQFTLGDWVDGRVKASAFSIDGVKVLREASKGLAHLHSLKFVHRDVKPANILLQLMSARSEYIAVISDFGFSKKIQPGKLSYSNTSGVRGTIDWIAPEVLKRLEDKNCQVSLTTAVDVFSMGCVYYYVLTFMEGNEGHHPFGGTFHRQSNILTNKHDLSHLTKNAKGANTLIKLMISEDPVKRPTIEAVLKHPIFWSNKKILTFFSDVSNRIARKTEDELPILKRFTEGGGAVVGSDWMAHLGSDAVTTQLQKARSYKEDSVRDLLRAVRNLKTHFYELDPEIQKELGESPHQFAGYWMGKFPALLPYTWECFEGLKKEDAFTKYYHQDYDFGGSLAVEEFSKMTLSSKTLEKNGETENTAKDILPIQVVEEQDPMLTKLTLESITNIPGKASKAIVVAEFQKKNMTGQWVMSKASKRPPVWKSVCTIKGPDGDVGSVEGFGVSKKEAENNAALEIIQKYFTTKNS